METLRHAARREGYELFTCTEHPRCTLSVLTYMGQWTEHKCPYLQTPTKWSWSMYGPSLLEQTWSMADTAYDELLGVQFDATDYERGQEYGEIRGRLLGYCDVLAIFMTPHFSTRNEIANEVVKRHQMRKEGEDYETPGLGARKYEPPPADNKYMVKQAVPVNLPDDEIELIKGIPEGSATDAQIAKMFSTTVAVVRQVRAS